eukprot:14476418-Ditylum_brightwellii.AAC.1
MERRQDFGRVKEKIVGYQLIKYHIVFGIKLDGLVQKARDIVQIVFLIAALNDLDVMTVII